MLRRSVLCALALVALFALESCGVNRLAGPQVGDARGPAAGSLGDHPREDGGGGGLPGMDPTFESPGSSADTLRTGGDDGNGRGRTE